MIVESGGSVLRRLDESSAGKVVSYGCTRSEYEEESDIGRVALSSEYKNTHHLAILGLWSPVTDFLP